MLGPTLTDDYHSRLVHDQVQRRANKVADACFVSNSRLLDIAIDESASRSAQIESVLGAFQR